MANRWPVILVLALTVLSGATQAQESTTITVLPQPAETITMAMGQSTTIAVSRSFATIQIVDPNIVDAIAETNRRVTFVPKALGTTTVNILDQNNTRVASLLVNIDEIGIGRVKIHNQARLGSVTTYRCGASASGGESIGCDLIKEDIMKAPAPVLTNNERREILIRGTPPAGTVISP
jgi:hypothetical protein